MNEKWIRFIAFIIVNGATLPLLYMMILTPAESTLIQAFIYMMTALTWIVMNVTAFHLHIALLSKDEPMIRYGYGFIALQVIALLYMDFVNVENIIANVVLGLTLVVTMIALLVTIARNR